MPAVVVVRIRRTRREHWSWHCGRFWIISKQRRGLPLYLFGQSVPPPLFNGPRRHGYFEKHCRLHHICIAVLGCDPDYRLLTSISSRRHFQLYACRCFRLLQVYSPFILFLLQARFLYNLQAPGMLRLSDKLYELRLSSGNRTSWHLPLRAGRLPGSRA